jgi:hypothetical protein
VKRLASKAARNVVSVTPNRGDAGDRGGHQHELEKGDDGEMIHSLSPVLSTAARAAAPIF